MGAEQLSFRVQHPGPLQTLTSQYPTIHLALWCDWRHEVLELVGAEPEAVKALRGVLEAHTQRHEGYALDDGVHVFVIDCIDLPHDAVNKAIDAAGCINLPPTRFVEGWEHYEVVSFREDASRDLMGRIQGTGRAVELTSKRPLNVQAFLKMRGAGLAPVVESLTDRQLEAVLLAHHHGYYASPRRVTAEAIADAAGLSRSTFEEHLRKAENKLLAGLVPYLELHRRARAVPPPASTAA